MSLQQILTPSALEFITQLQRKFGSTREALLVRRAEVQARINAGFLPDFLAETRDIREGDWKIAPVPKDLEDRCVEITGPVDRKMVINALNSGAQVYMADFEDSHSPIWSGTLEGQINLRDAVRRQISFTSSEGKEYTLVPKPAVLMVRPRGWHLLEKHHQVDGKPMSASLFDFGLFFFHNAAELLKRGTAPYFYLPKMESHLEARLWNDVFIYAQEQLKIPKGTIRATVLIETILGAFEMDEILYELREHSAGLNCGRWDYIFSFIKKFRLRPDFVLPDRDQVTMNVHFLKSYAELLIKTCHRRGAHAMGGMAAQVPIKNDSEANAAALAKVRADKEREVGFGHDGTWVAHPGLVEIAYRTFKTVMKGPNQLSRLREDVNVKATDLLTVPPGEVTDEGVRNNIEVALTYLESWLRGVGCVPIHHLMEDAATVEISRAQLWQWLRYGKLKEKEFHGLLLQELDRARSLYGDEKFHRGKFDTAAKILNNVIMNEQFVEFITLPAYDHLP